MTSRLRARSYVNPGYSRFGYTISGVPEETLAPDEELLLSPMEPGDLLIFDGRQTKAVVKNVYIADYAWRPDGKSVAYSKAGSLVFHDLTTGAEQEIAFPDIDKRLQSHVALRICWRPDSQALACTIMFLGGRMWGGPKIFGDDELFVIPRRGQPSWFRPGEKLDEVQIEWVNPPRTEQQPVP